MRNKILTVLFILFSSSVVFAGLLSDCTNKRFSREMEYLLMNQCMSTYNFMSNSQYKDKLNACACYIGSLACEYDGNDATLIKKAEADQKIENNDKKYKKCSEKDNGFDRNQADAVAQKAIDDAD